MDNKIACLGFQGCKNFWIFLTPDHSLSTFLPAFYEEIDKDDNTKPMKFVWKKVKWPYPLLYFFDHYK